MNREFTIVEALQSLRPGAAWSHVDGVLNWLDKEQIQPTQSEINVEIARLEKEWVDTEYQRLRAKEYPPVEGFLDAIVKGDEAQKQAYIDACLAVKQKYPKPESV